MVRGLLNRARVEVLKQTRSRGARLVWVRCECGETFRHTASRPTMVCFLCGRSARLPRPRRASVVTLRRPDTKHKAMKRHR